MTGAFSDVAPSTMTAVFGLIGKLDPSMRLTHNSVVIELLQKSPMREAIKGLREVEDHKVHLPSCIHCLSKLMH